MKKIADTKALRQIQKELKEKYDPQKKHGDDLRRYRLSRLRVHQGQRSTRSRNKKTKHQCGSSRHRVFRLL